jgi:hypothetical protein
LKPAQASSSREPVSKKNITHTQKSAGGVAQGIGPEFKPQFTKKEKENETKAG